jgi:glycosyltransferase involved in cell wall biosynthesis
VEWLVIDDGSTDGTAEVARMLGVDSVVRFPQNRGLAKAFIAGLDEAVARGADFVVNTDADNQYRAADIARLLDPLLSGEAQIAVGARPIETMIHFSRAKRLLQRLGSRIVRRLSGTAVADAPSGFRAMTREAAMRLHVFSEYTYTLETLIQAGYRGMATVSVPVGVNAPTRPSRLMGSSGGYIRRQVLTLLRIVMTYRPFQFFSVPGVLALAAGVLIGVRFLYFYATGNGSGHVQSLILGALLMGMGFLLIVIGLIADLISVNRKLLEDLDWRLKRMEVRGSEFSPPRRD